MSLRTASAMLPQCHPHFCPNQSIHLETETINIYEQCGLFSAVPLYPLVFGGAPQGFLIQSKQRWSKEHQDGTEKHMSVPAGGNVVVL